MASALQVARLLHPITALGPGRRIGLWLQGCTLACPGCISVDTWDAEGGIRTDVEEMIGRLLGIIDADDSLTGVTVTGGEPFQQPAVAEVLESIRTQRFERDLDVLVYTGYTAATARRRAPRLWAAADIVVAGRYRRTQPWGGPLAGSDNQTEHVLTSRGRERLAAVERAHPVGLQAVVDDGDLVMVGIPRPGDMDRLRERLAARGIRMNEVSWRS